MWPLDCEASQLGVRSTLDSLMCVYYYLFEEKSVCYCYLFPFLSIFIWRFLCGLVWGRLQYLGAYFEPLFNFVSILLLLHLQSKLSFDCPSYYIHL